MMSARTTPRRERTFHVRQRARPVSPGKPDGAARPEKPLLTARRFGNPLAAVVRGSEPTYFTAAGAAYLGDAGELLPRVEGESVQLILTSPPFALIRKKPYGNVASEKYADWFMNFADELRRVLTPDGSLVIDLGGAWWNGSPVKSTYQFELLLKLTKRNRFYLAQDLYWWNPSRLPSPAEWVNVRRVRVKDAVNTIWWLSKSPHPKANNSRVLTEYSRSQRLLFENGVKPAVRPSGHEMSQNFLNQNGGAIPSNLLKIANTDSNSRYLRRCREAGQPPHPARFPRQLPEFFIRMLTDREGAGVPGDIVLDPFAGSNMTGWVSQSEGRRWISFETDAG